MAHTFSWQSTVQVQYQLSPLKASNTHTWLQGFCGCRKALQVEVSPAFMCVWTGTTRPSPTVAVKGRGRATPFTCSSLLGNEAPLSGGSSVFSPSSKAKHRKAPEKCAVHLKQHQPNTVLQAKRVRNEKQRGSLFTQRVENKSPFPPLSTDFSCSIQFFLLWLDNVFFLAKFSTLSEEPSVSHHSEVSLGCFLTYICVNVFSRCPAVSVR